MARSARVNEPVVISTVLFDGKTNRFIRAFIYDQSGSLLQQVDLIHRGLGMYHQTFVPTTTQQLTVVTVVYLDGGYSIEDEDYQREGDVIFVSPHTEVDPEEISNSVWDSVLPGQHDIPNTAGLFLQVARETVLDINNVILSNPTYSLPAIEQKILANRTILQGEINANELKIDTLTAQEAAYYSTLLTQHSQTQSDISGVNSNLNTKSNSIISEINANEVKIDSLTSQISALQEQSKFVAIVPEKMVRPETGTKIYQFFLSVYDVNGLPNAPDTTPKVKIINSAGGTFLAESNMVAMSQVGQYYFNLNLSTGSSYPVVRIEFKVVEGGQTYYIQRASEIAQFDGDIAALEAKLNTIDVTTTDNYNLLTGGNGLAQLKTEILTNRNEINANEVKLNQIKSKTDWIISNPVSITDLDQVEFKIDSLPSYTNIQSLLNAQTGYLQGTGGYNLTDIYNNIFSPGIPADYAKESTLTTARNQILAELSNVESAVGGLPNVSYFNPQFFSLATTISEVAGSGFDTSEHSLVSIKNALGVGGSSASDIWSYPTRQLTAYPDFESAIDDAAESIIDNLTHYRCNMTTTINTSEDKQEVLCWLDVNNQTISYTSNARITVSDGASDLWSGSLLSPDSRGVFRITRSGISSLINQPDRNFVMTITIEMSGQDYTTVQPFYTV